MKIKSNKYYPQIDILLSIYNGEEYLEELLNSLLSQTYKNWRLIIRDDGSQDSTLKIINDLNKIFKNKIVLIKGSNIGPVKSFEQLLLASQAKYLMLCDQDDVWYSEKVEIEILKLVEIEKDYPNKPCLVYGDLVVVDQNLKLIANSFWQYHKIKPADHKEPRLLLENPGAGCTMVFNRNLVNYSLPFPKDIIMHDWWLLLIAAYLGKIAFIESPTILYRQHPLNKVGAKNISIHRVFSSFTKLRIEITKTTNLYRRTLHQANKLIDRFGSILDERDKVLIQKYVNSGESTTLKRKLLFIDNNFMYSNFIRKIFQLLFL